MEELHAWFLENRRSFPWRETRSPYQVLVSEVMLQQTRASVVIPYFQRWIEEFPTVETLAAAPIEKVIKLWEGLGYYSRARNLHLAAQEIVSRFQGEVPNFYEALSTLPGLGPYTIGAILSFGFHKRAVAVDGNVARVGSRYFAIEEEINRLKVRRLIEEKINGLLDLEKPWVTMEGLIELGATVCKPKPLCAECPIRSSCGAFAKGIVERLPLKKRATEITFLKRRVAVVQSQEMVLVGKGERGKVMADLYEFPYFEEGEEFMGAIFQKFGLQVRLVRRLREITHTFTKFKALLYPYLLKTDTPLPIPGWDWMTKKDLYRLPFSAGHRKILKEILQ